MFSRSRAKGSPRQDRLVHNSRHRSTPEPRPTRSNHRPFHASNLEDSLSDLDIARPSTNQPTLAIAELSIMATATANYPPPASSSTFLPRDDFPRGSRLFESHPSREARLLPPTMRDSAFNGGFGSTASFEQAISPPSRQPPDRRSPPRVSIFQDPMDQRYSDPFAGSRPDPRHSPRDWPSDWPSYSPSDQSPPRRTSDPLTPIYSLEPSRTASSQPSASSTRPSVRYHTQRKLANRDEFDGPHQFLPPPSPRSLAAADRDLLHLPTHLSAPEQDEILSTCHAILSKCAYDFVAKYRFPVPLEPDKTSVSSPADREWSEWAYLLKRLATKRRIPARVLYNNQIKQLVTVLENALEIRHQPGSSGMGAKDDRHVLQVISAGTQVAKILKDAGAMEGLDRLYVRTEARIQERKERGRAMGMGGLMS